MHKKTKNKMNKNTTIVLLLLLMINFISCGIKESNKKEIPEISYIGNIQTGNAFEKTVKGKNLAQKRGFVTPWTHKVDKDYAHASKKAHKKFDDHKIGIRIHWGVYSLNGSNPSWSLWNKAEKGTLTETKKKIKYIDYVKEYCTLYQDFNPVKYKPKEWAKLFKECGMQFAVLTTKHHDGFSMFDTKTTVNALEKTKGADGKLTYKQIRNHYSIMDTPYNKDIIASFCDAMRTEDLGVGLYFSNPDWMDYDFRFDMRNLYRDTTYTLSSNPDGYKRAAMRYRTQLLELSSNYGQLDRLSLDLGIPMDMWSYTKETLKEVRKLQPDMMIRRRGIGAWGDYFTPEGKTPVLPKTDKNFYKKAKHIAVKGMSWSKIGATGNHPGYSPDLKAIDPEPVIESLIEIVSLGGNLQLGFGPSSEGEFHPESIKLLKKLGAWLKVNGEAIYHTRGRDGANYKESKTVAFTKSKKDKTVYALVTKMPEKQLHLKTVKAKKGSKITLLGYHKELKWTQNNKGLFIKIPEELKKPENRPCKYAWSFKIEIEKKQ